MDILKILDEYDTMFGRYSLEEIENYLLDHLNQSFALSLNNVSFTLLNEIIGFYRDITKKDKALYYCDKLIELLEVMKLEGTIEYATALSNIANAYRAFGLYEKSIAYFNETYKSYCEQLDMNDLRFAGLYNNWSLVYQEMGDYECSKELLYRSLKVIDLYDDDIKKAITRSNLASSLIMLGDDEAYDEAMVYLKEAFDIFEKDGGEDYHFSGALVTMGDAYYYKNDKTLAAYYYKRGLDEIEKHTGKNENYDRVLKKYEEVKSHSSLIELSCDFYKKYGKEMISTHFKEYEERIAVGIVGEGSDCLGFDDEISKDHDYDIGFCMWLSDDDYKTMGDALQNEYENLIGRHFKEHDGLLKKRRGVFAINDFYNDILNTNCDYESGAEIDYENIDEHRLLNAINGKIFYDSCGLMTSIRNKIINYYPKDVFNRKLAKELHDFSQYAQSNYPRMMARDDYISASLCVSKAIESTMNIVYLLSRTYAPYYKWKNKGLETNELYGQIKPCIEEILLLERQNKAWEDKKYDASKINEDDQCVVLFEKIASILLDELNRQELVYGNEKFLESYVNVVLKGLRNDLIDRIILEEWNQFDKVENIGGRAFCQDDYETFSIMRESQYKTWNNDLLKSYYEDLMNAKNMGWNMISEKYARMMESNDPIGYLTVKDYLPVIDEQRKLIQEEIIKIQVNWMEELANQYPKLAYNARSIRSEDDEIDNTSYETYLRGEISTYSSKTLLLYGRMIADYLKDNKNLAYETMKNTCELYGYHTLDEVEKSL